MFFAIAGEVTPKRNAVLRGAKTEPVRITGEVTRRIGRKKINLLAQ